MSNLSPLVSTDWLADHLTDPDIQPVDCSFYLPIQGRNPQAEFAAEHIPGAVYFDIDQIAEPDTGLPHTWPSNDRFATEVGKLGISNNDTVICYQTGHFGAARVWWMFKAFGHKHVAVLDGNLDLWKQQGYPLQSGKAEPEPANYQAEFNTTLVCDWKTVLRALESSRSQIVDARSAERFSGSAPEPRQGVRSGHMPGALNLPYNLLYDEQGRYRSTAELGEIFQSAGVKPDQPIITTCGSGVSAANLLLGLELIGRHDATLYDGSWSEWGSRNDTPVAVSE